MKLRIDFVTNSSSTAYYITNTSNERKTLVDFVLENPHILDDFKYQYDWYDDDPRFTEAKFLESAARDFDEIFEPGRRKYCVFGDEQGTVIGNVFDYMLRGGGKSKSFIWSFAESLR